jgi:transcriptional regulator with XRE-family HTH domain
MTLREWMAAESISQAALAKALGKDPSYVCKIRKFELTPSLQVAFFIQKISGGKVRPEDLISERTFKRWCADYIVDPTKFETIMNAINAKYRWNEVESQVKN